MEAGRTVVAAERKGMRKLRALWKVLKSRNYIVLAEEPNGISSTSHVIGGVGQLIEFMSVLPRLEDNMRENILAQAIEAGEVKVIKQMIKEVEKKLDGSKKG